MQENSGKIPISEDDLKQRLHAMLTEGTAIKNRGNEFFKNENFQEAEAAYLEGITKVTSYYEEIQLYNCGSINDEIAKMLTELRVLERSLRGNLALTYKREGKKRENIRTLAYIIKEVDPDHSQSYIRLITNLLDNGEILKAKVILQDAKAKFSGTGDSSNFAKIEDDLLKIEEKIFGEVKPDKKKPKESNLTRLALAGTTGLTTMLGAMYIFYKYGKNYLKSN